eukprot:gene12830-12930_t
MARKSDSTLDRARILDAAYALLDEAGLDAITMRALAARLGVQAPALYWHIRDKADLMALLARNIHARARPAAEAGTPQRWLLALGRGLATALRRHRDAARLLASASPDRPPTADEAQAMAQPLTDWGYSVEQALAAQAAVISLTLGWAVYRGNAPMAEYLSSMFDLDAAYDQGLVRLVEGLTART